MERDAPRTRTEGLYVKTIALSLVVFAMVALLHRREFVFTAGPGSNVSITLHKGNFRATSVGHLSLTKDAGNGKSLNATRIASEKLQKMIPASSSLKSKAEGNRSKMMGASAPKVALLYLSRRGLHNEPVWRAFFEVAGRLSFRFDAPESPIVSFVEDIGKDRFDKINQRRQRALQQTENIQSLSACDDEPLYLNGELDRLLNHSEGNSVVIAKQKLFSVYTHPSRGYSFPEGSIFRGTEIHDRLDTRDSWASFSLVAAEIKLFKAALKDERNMKFVLLSESCVPLHRPEVVYLQLLSEEKSRLNACHPFAKSNMMSRWDSRMKTQYLTSKNFRKSSQWACLNRSHAEIIAKETHVREKFRRYCRTHSKHHCVPDEHYIPTAISVYGVENETNCKGHLTAAWWPSNGRLHPVTFSPRNTNAVLWKKLRHMEKCAAGTSQASTQHIFHERLQVERCLLMNVTEIQLTEETDNWIVRNGYIPMDSSCTLFARKFSIHSVRETTKTALACAGGALGYWC